VFWSVTEGATATALLLASGKKGLVRICQLGRMINVDLIANLSNHEEERKGEKGKRKYPNPYL